MSIIGISENVINEVVVEVLPIIIDKSTIFYEKINISKLRYIYANPNEYEGIIRNEDKGMRRYNNYNAWTSIKKIIDNILIPKELKGTDYGYIKVSYDYGKNSNNIGRLYAEKSIGLQSLVGCVRHTICNELWTDIDQVNSHPNIFKKLIEDNGFKSNILNECINNREVFLAKVGGNRDEAKTKVIAIINGGSFDDNKILFNLRNEIKPFIESIINLPEYNDILTFVKKTYNQDDNIEGKTISRILQVKESELLKCYIDYANSRKMLYDINHQNIPFISLIFDGFQLPSKYNITDELLLDFQNYAFNVTGFMIPLKIKPFDNPLIIPDNYKKRFDAIPNELKEDDFLTSIIDKSLGTDGSHYSIATVISIVYKDRIVYDADEECWFIINNNNIWEKYKKFIQFNTICANDICRLYMMRSAMFSLLMLTPDIPEVAKSIYEEKSKKCLKIGIKLQDVNFVNSILTAFTSQMVIPKFSSEIIDNKTHLFAFNDKVFDFNTNLYRDIEPTDYIMTTTGYNFPANIDPKDTEFLNNYFECVFPDKDKRDYVLDSTCKTINANNNEQYFNIHTGNGSNSKTTFNNLFATAIGGYGCEISPETFTKPKKSANDTGELYKAKGKRAIFANEPESNQDKLQTAILKRIADESGRTIIARELYSNAIEFKITFKLNFFCNNKPELSSIDGGIARRVRVIHWDIKFVLNPNSENPLEKPQDPDFMDKMRTDGVKNAFIIMMINRWTERVSNFKLIPVPKVIVDAGTDYIEDCNPVLGFINQYCILTNNHKDNTISSSILFNKFSNSNGGEKISTKRFKDDIMGISGILFKKTKIGNVFTGLKFRDDDNYDDDDE